MNEKLNEINFLKQRTEAEIVQYRRKISELNEQYSKEIESCVFLNFNLIVNSYKEIHALESKLSQLNAVFDDQNNSIKSIMSIIGLKNDTISAVKSVKNGDNALYLIDYVQNLPLGYNELRGRTVVFQVTLRDNTDLIYYAILTEDLIILCSVNDSDVIYKKFYSLSDIVTRCCLKDDSEQLIIEFYSKSSDTSYCFTANTDDLTRALFDNIKRTQLQAGKFIQKTELESLLSSVEDLPEMDIDSTVDYYDDLEEVNSASRDRIRTVRLYLLSEYLILAERNVDKLFFKNMSPRGLVEWIGMGDGNFFKLRIDDHFFCFLADSASKKKRWKNLLSSEATCKSCSSEKNGDFVEFCSSFEIALLSHDFVSATKLIDSNESLSKSLTSEESQKYSKMKTELVEQVSYELQCILDRPVRVAISDLCGLIECMIDLKVTYLALRIFFTAKSMELKSVIRSVRLKSDFISFITTLTENCYFFIISSYIEFRKAFSKDSKAFPTGVVWMRKEFISLANVLFWHIFDDSKDIFTVITCLNKMKENSTAVIRLIYSKFSRFGYDITADYVENIIEPMVQYLVKCSRLHIQSTESINHDSGKFISFSNAATCVKFTDKYIKEMPNITSFIEGSSLLVTQWQWSLIQRNGRFLRAVLSLPVDDCQSTVLQVMGDVLKTQLQMLHRHRRSSSDNQIVNINIEFVINCFLPAIFNAFLNRFGLTETPPIFTKLVNYFKVPE